MYNFVSVLIYTVTGQKKEFSLNSDRKIRLKISEKNGAPTNFWHTVSLGIIRFMVVCAGGEGAGPARLLQALRGRLQVGQLVLR